MSENLRGVSRRETSGGDTMTVPSVGLRDRVACELANLEYERSGRPCETEDFYANADRVLSVLHEAGTQEDEDDGYEVMCEPVAAMVEEVRAALAPVQQEPERYSDRERVADYLASAQGVEFHDLNDDARREWLACASDALRAVWSVGRLTDPVQRESEDRITRPGGWHGMMMLTDAAYRSGYEYRKAEFAPVPSVGLRDRLLGIMGTQVKPDPPSLTVMKDAQRRPYSDGFRDGQIMAVNRLRPALSEALSVLHEAGDGEVLRVVRDDDGYTIMLPGDGAWASSSDPRMLESYLALRLSEVAAEAGLPALAPDMPWAGPSAEAGTQDDDENESHAQFLEALAFGWDNDQPEARRLYRIAEVLRLPAPAEAGTQEDEADADVMAQISTMIPVREVVSEWRAWSPQSAPRTKYRDRADAEADAQELLRNEYRDVVVQRRRVGPWLPVTPAPAVSGSPDTQRQHREMFDTFAPTEPTIDDVPRSEIADEAQTQSLLAGWLTDAQHYDGALGNDAVGECVARRMAEQGWRLQRTVSGTPDTKEDEL